jgi:acyl carrier protein
MTVAKNQPLTAERIHEVLWQAVAQRAGEDPSKLTSQARLLQDLGFDSLDMAELAMELEDALGISLPDEVLENPGLTLGEIEQAIRTRCLG